MQDILRNNPSDKRKSYALAFGIALSVYISIVMFLGNANQEVDVDMIYGLSASIWLVAQGIFSLLIFVVAPWIFIAVALKVPISDFFPKVSLSTVGLTALICLSFMVVNSAVGEWNMNLDFGESAFGQWARRSEDLLKTLTEYLTDFTGVFHFIIAFIVIAVIPAVGEELLFRGLIQNFFSRAFNHHLAIWITGFLFAAVHMQFFGVLPRMFLGVLFGYLFHWSGKLSVAIIGHLINNGLALIVLYSMQRGLTDLEPEQMEQSAPWGAVLLFAGLTIVLLRVFYNRFNHA